MRKNGTFWLKMVIFGAEIGGKMVVFGSNCGKNGDFGVRNGDFEVK